METAVCRPLYFPLHAKLFEKFLCRVKDSENLSSKTGYVDSGWSPQVGILARWPVRPRQEIDPMSTEICVGLVTIPMRGS